MSAEYLAELVTFFVMFALIAWFGWPRIREAAQKQQDRISAALDDAEKTRLEVAASLAESRKQLDEARQQADSIIAQAKKTAQEEADDTRVKAAREAESFLVQATGQIAAERERAIQDLRREMGELVVDAASRAVSSALTADGHKRLVSSTVSRLAPKTGGKN